MVVSASTSVQRTRRMCVRGRRSSSWGRTRSEGKSSNGGAGGRWSGGACAEGRELVVTSTTRRKKTRRQNAGIVFAEKYRKADGAGLLVVETAATQEDVTTNKKRGARNRDAGGPVEKLAARLERNAGGRGEGRGRKFDRRALAADVRAFISCAGRVKASEEDRQRAILPGTEAHEREREKLYVTLKMLCRSGLSDAAIALVSSPAMYECESVVSPDDIAFSIVSSRLVLEAKGDSTSRLCQLVSVLDDSMATMSEEHRAFIAKQMVPVLNAWIQRCTSLKIAITVLKDMEARGVHPDSKTYSLLAPLLCQAGKAAQLPALVGFERNVTIVADDDCQWRVNDDVVPDMRTVNRIMYLLDKNEMNEGAEAIFHALDGGSDGELGQLRSDPATVSIILAILGQKGSADEALKLCHTFKENGILSCIAVNALIDACAKSGHFEAAHQVFDAMPALGLLPDAATASAMFTVYGRGGDVQAALELCRIIARRGAMNTFALNTLIDVCSSEENFRAAVEVFESMSALGLQPDTKTYTRLLQVCGKLKRDDVAARVAESLEARLRRDDASSIDDEGVAEIDGVECTERGHVQARRRGQGAPPASNSSSSDDCGHVVVDDGLANALVYAFAKTGNVELTQYYLDFLHAEHAHVKLTPETRYRLVAVFSRSNFQYVGQFAGAAEQRFGAHVRAVSEFMSLYEDKIPIDTMVVRSLMRSVAVHDDTHTCVRVLRIMEEFGLTADNTIWMYVMHCLGTDPEFWPIARAFNSRLVNAGKYVPTRVVTAILSRGARYAMHVGLDVWM